MPKVKQRTSNTKEKQLQKAIRVVQNGLEGGVAAAVELFGMSRTTLYYRLSGGRKSWQAAHEEQQRLTSAEEKAVVKWCFQMDDRGFPPRLDYVKDMALHLESQRTGTKSKPIGKNWIGRFLNRHPTLATKYSMKLDRQRAHANDPRIIKDYFAKLTSLISRHGLKAFQIFNMDKKGFLMGMASRAKVLCCRGRRNPRVTHDGNRELVTVVETVSAAGFALPPLVINKGQAHYMGWSGNLTEKERNYEFSYSPKGWIDNRLAMLWLESIFEPETSSLVGALPRLLILDGHGSHITYEFAHYCDEHNILLLCLPSHSTHLLQPLDVGLFSPYQHFYGRAVDDYMRSGRNAHGVKKAIFIPFLTEARDQTFTLKNIVQSFAATGIWPLCPRRVLTKMVPEKTSRRDTMGVIASPRTSRDIRRRIITAEQLLDEGIASLRLESTVPAGSSTQMLGQLGRVKAIMRDLGHQLETEIAHNEVFVQQTHRLQGLVEVYNRTDRRILSRARILSGATLMALHDKRLALDAKKIADRAAWLLKKASGKRRTTAAEITHSSLETVPDTPQLISTDDENKISDGNASVDSWANVPIIGNDYPYSNPVQTGSPAVGRQSPVFAARGLAPDRPLHMALRSRRPAVKFSTGSPRKG